MMIMTIRWSKATRLLEFSRSKFAPRHEEEVGSAHLRTWLFCDRGQRRTEKLGILVVGCDDTEEDIVGAGSGQSMTQNLHADIIQKFSSYQRKVTTD